MKIVLSTIGKFHTFDLARELFKHGYLEAIYTGYPHFKLKNENIPKDLIRSFPWLHAPYMALPQRERFGYRINKAWEYWDRKTFSQYVALNIPECDVFMGLSSSGLEAGKIVKQRGAKYICDRGSTHIRAQDTILREEHELWGIKYNPIDPKIIAREGAEYELADIITIPSLFNYSSFIENGVPEHKLRKVPYGVNLSKFSKVSSPSSDSFDVIFVGAVSVRKGIPYLLKAFAKLKHPRKSLTLVGSINPETVSWLRKAKLLTDEVKLLGAVPQQQLKELMSRAHVMVLPSVEEGLAMVQAQAMACGCPVIASTHTGAEDLYTDGKEGFIFPVRDVDILTELLQQLADNPELRESMSNASLCRVHELGGWSKYGKQVINLMKELTT